MHLVPISFDKKSEREHLWRSHANKLLGEINSLPGTVIVMGDWNADFGDNVDVEKPAGV